ncbi:MAG: N(4)-(beta-N-acetylglucosaminyl)-L-asparaginase [Chitinophagales bacterium]|nr:N(4)-(beta-N-acetylglucosaminyl)-L-asparaginase [Chitinophagales bacterium]
MSKRRAFLQQLAVLFPAIPLLKLTQVDYQPNKRPISIATWDSGLAVNDKAWEILNTGGKAIDAVEKGANSIENTINCCVGLGGNPDRDGYVTLDACIMDENHNCGSVAFLESIRNPISVARKIMENTPHVMLVGEGAKKFALANDFEDAGHELSPTAQSEYQHWLKSSKYQPEINIEQRQSQKTKVPQKLKDGSFNHDTMGIIAMDAGGDLSGACTTSGMGFKMRGRVGDSPIIGAGLFVDNEVGAATSSGQGEEVIRICGTHTVVEMMRLGKSPEEACKIAIERIIKINPEKAKTFQVGFLALNKRGEYGAYAIQPGFSYAVKDGDDPGSVYPSKSYFD